MLGGKGIANTATGSSGHGQAVHIGQSIINVQIRVGRGAGLSSFTTGVVLLILCGWVLAICGRASSDAGGWWRS